MQSLRRGWQIACAIALAGFVSAGAAPARAAATDEFRALRGALVHDKAAQNWASYLAHARKLRTLLNGSPVSHLEVARAELNLSDVKAAVGDISAVLAMGEVNPVMRTPLFKPLRKAVEAGFEANGRAVSAASVAFTLSDSGLLPEDIDYDTTSGRFFLSSVLERKIIARDAKGRETDFAKPRNGWPVLALKLDTRRRILWASEVALDGFGGVPAAEQGRSAVLEYNLDTARLIARIAPPFHCALGDMALAPDGTPLLSDGDGGGVYRLRGTVLQRIDHGEFISPQTIAVDRSAQRLFVPDYLRGIGIMPLSGGAVHWISMQDRYALEGIDGLYIDRGMLLAVQNGTAPERVAAFFLDGSGTQIVRQRIMEQATAAFGDPTHGVIAGDDFYYIANSGWDKIDAHGRLVPGLALTPARIMRVRLATFR